MRFIAFLFLCLPAFAGLTPEQESLFSDAKEAVRAHYAYWKHAQEDLEADISTLNKQTTGADFLSQDVDAGALGKQLMSMMMQGQNPIEGLGDADYQSYFVNQMSKIKAPRHKLDLARVILESAAGLCEVWGDLYKIFIHIELFSRKKPEKREQFVKSLFSSQRPFLEMIYDRFQFSRQTTAQQYYMFGGGVMTGDVVSKGAVQASYDIGSFEVYNIQSLANLMHQLGSSLGDNYVGHDLVFDLPDTWATHLPNDEKRTFLIKLTHAHQNTRDRSGFSVRSIGNNNEGDTPMRRWAQDELRKLNAPAKAAQERRMAAAALKAREAERHAREKGKEALEKAQRKPTVPRPLIQTSVQPQWIDTGPKKVNHKAEVMAAHAAKGTKVKTQGTPSAQEPKLQAPETTVTPHNTFIPKLTKGLRRTYLDICRGATGIKIDSVKSLIKTMGGAFWWHSLGRDGWQRQSQQSSNCGAHGLGQTRAKPNRHSTHLER